MKLINFDYDKYVKEPKRYQIYRCVYGSAYGRCYPVNKDEIEYPINISNTYFIRISGLSYTKDGFFQLSRKNPITDDHIKMAEVRKPMFYEAD